MPDEGISYPVKQFIREFIQSVEQLEILLLVRREPNRQWTPKEVFEVVRSSERSVADRLAQFTERRLLAASGADTAVRYRFSPRDSDAARLLDELASAYQSHRVLVIETIFKPDADPAQSFSDAFKLRKP